MLTVSQKLMFKKTVFISSGMSDETMMCIACRKNIEDKAIQATAVCGDTVYVCFKSGIPCYYNWLDEKRPGGIIRAETVYLSEPAKSKE